MTELGLFRMPKLLCFGVMVASCSYATTLGVDNSATTTHYQQTFDDPCIFGGSDCQPAPGFPTETSIAVGGSVSTVDAGTVGGGASNGQAVLFNVTAAQIRALAGGLFGNTFLIGVDINQSGNAFINMLQFDVWDTTTNTELATLPTNTQLNIFHNGTGFSDALLSSVSISGLAGTDIIQFRLRYNNASDGTDSFFLISTAAPPPQIPEPLTLGLTGAGLVGIYFVRRRRPSSL